MSYFHEPSTHLYYLFDSFRLSSQTRYKFTKAEFAVVSKKKKGCRLMMFCAIACVSRVARYVLQKGNRRGPGSSLEQWQMEDEWILKSQHVRSRVKRSSLNLMNNEYVTTEHLYIYSVNVTDWKSIQISMHTIGARTLACVVVIHCILYILLCEKWILHQEPEWHLRSWSHQNTKRSQDKMDATTRSHPGQKKHHMGFC